MQKSKLRLVAWLFSHEVHSIIRLWKSSMLKDWKTLQEGWVNALDTLYDLFLIPDNLICMGESYHMVQIKRVSSTEKFMICLINKCSFIFLTQSKKKTEFSQLHGNEIQFRCHNITYFMLHNITYVILHNMTHVI